MSNDQTEKRPPGATQDERLLETPRPDEFLRTDTWRVFRIMGEFVQGFEDLAQITNGVAVFGSARTHPDDPVYQSARETDSLLPRFGFAVNTGVGSGIMTDAHH